MATSSLGSLTTYTVGWVAALHHERAAALEMLDEEHEPPQDFRKNAADTNSYSWGSMGKHNIVIASLPSGEYGTTAAADTAAGMRASLPHMRIGLFVGIGAGITGETTEKDGVITVKREILLGDVVVSNPSDGNGGVVQHDVKKVRVMEGRKVYQLNGFLDAPPRALRAPLSNLRAYHERRDSKIQDYLEVFKKNRKMRKPYSYPGARYDPLREVLQRQRRTSEAGDDDDDDNNNECIRDHPEIHYGTIASGDTLIKSAEERDSIVRWLQDNNIDPICFEMEARGIMNSFPCLVIRGICDYADERKNDTWQRYAAATAAAFAKEFLEHVDPQEVEDSKSIGNLVENVVQIRKTIDQVQSDTSEIRAITLHGENNATLDFLSTEDYSKAFNATLAQHLDGTGAWFLYSEAFSRWKQSKEHHLLYCPGEPGAGKTILSAQVIDHLQRSPDTRHAVLYIFCDYAKRDEQNISHFHSALLRQISACFLRAPDSVLGLLEEYRRTKRCPSHVELSGILHEVLSAVDRTYIVIDALDECKPSDCIELVQLIRSLTQQCNVKCLATSRRVLAIDKLFTGALQLEVKAPDSDIENFVRANLSAIQTKIDIDDALSQRIVEKVVRAAGRLFLLARLHMESFESKTNVRDIEDTLKNLAGDYHRAYDNAMRRIQMQEKELIGLATSVLTWVARAKRPLLVEELRHALAVRPGDKTMVSTGIVKIELLLSVCAGLVVQTSAGVGYRETVAVRFAHFTVEQYFAETRHNWLPRADVTLANACVAYMSFEMHNSLYLDVLTNYAYTFWESHVEDVEKDGSDDDIQELTRAMQTALESLIGAANIHRWKAKIWHTLARTNCIRLFTSLLAYAIVGDPPDTERRSSLSWAVSCGYEDFTMALCSSHANMIGLVDHEGRSPIWWAAVSNREKSLRVMLEHETSSVNVADKHGRTPLRMASERGFEGIVQCLCAVHGVDVNKTDSTGTTPLNAAVNRGHAAVVRVLCSVDGIDGNCYDCRGFVPPEIAGDSGFYVVRPLHVAKEMDVDLSRRTGFAPLHIAAHRGYADIVRLLCQCRGIVVNSLDPRGWTALEIAVRRGDEAVVKILCSVDDTLVHGPPHIVSAGTLSAAVFRTRPEIVKLLCAVPGVDLNLVDENGDTPLHAAVRAGRAENVQVLLDCGDVQTGVLNDGETLLSTAMLRDDRVVFGKLLEHSGLRETLWQCRGAVPFFTAVVKKLRLALLTPYEACEDKDCPGFQPIPTLRGRLKTQTDAHCSGRGQTTLAWSSSPVGRMDDPPRPRILPHPLWILYVHVSLRAAWGPHDETQDTAISWLSQAMPELHQYDVFTLNLGRATVRRAMRYLQCCLVCFRCGEYPDFGGLHCPACAKCHKTLFQADLCYTCAAQGHWCSAAGTKGHVLQDFASFIHTGALPIATRVHRASRERALASAQLFHDYSVRAVWCDVCGAIGIPAGFHCPDCREGHFDICLDCVQHGRWCSDITHSLQEYGEIVRPGGSHDWISYTRATRRRMSAGSCSGGCFRSLDFAKDGFHRDVGHDTDCIGRAGGCSCAENWSLLLPYEMDSDESVYASAREWLGSQAECTQSTVVDAEDFAFAREGREDATLKRRAEVSPRREARGSLAARQDDASNHEAKD